MAIIVGGHETGLLDTSLGQLDRDDRTSESETGQGEQLHVNVSNGNLVLTQEDTFLPSQGADYQLIRTYNSRGVPSDAGQRDDARWSLTTGVSLNETNSGGEKHFLLTYGDGSVLEFRLDEESGQYVSTDGQGAYETLEDLNAKGNAEVYFVVTRADQSRLSFNKFGDVLLWEDTNGVATEYRYSQNRLVQVRDDDGHVINYKYAQGNLVAVTDEKEDVLVQYSYDKGRLAQVQDRFGHVTKYFYSSDGFLIRVVLPNKQTVDGKVETYDNREINFEYEAVNWSNGDSGRAKVLTRLVDAEGNITTFDYDFNLRNDNTASTDTGSGKNNNKNKNTVAVGDDDKFYDGGTTRVVDALGNDRAYSNETIYKQWRTSNGYYATYNANAVSSDAALALQLEEIRSAHSLTYTYDGNGYITAVVDQQQFETSYVYDDLGNLLSVTDRNGWGAVNSDSAYYRDLRQSLGYERLLADLSGADRTALIAAFTSTFAYDDRGNLTESTDNSGNTTLYTYTSFNKLASVTSPNGGVTTLSYDTKQNLIEQQDPSGDITRWTYDQYGNQTQRTVFLGTGASGTEQVTAYFYDMFGNNIRTRDAEGHLTKNTFDHFGNLTQSIDANNGVTSYFYDADNRLLSSIDPLGHTTVNTYDAVGNRISFTDANGKTITYIYDRNNRLITTIDPEATAPDTRTTNRQYDVVGNQVAVTDAEGRETAYRFNGRRELVEVISSTVKGADGTADVQYSTSYLYDGEGNGIRVNDNRGNSTDFLYQQDGLLREETNAIGHVTRYHYDANRNVLTIIAGAQLATGKQQKLTFAYDSEDQVFESTDAEGNVTGYTYDAPGTIASVTDGNGKRTDFEYDLNNRLVHEIRPEIVDPDTSIAQARYVMTHAFDPNGNEITTTDENGNSTAFSYDADNRLASITDANGIVTTYAYDPNDNITRVVIGEGSAEAQVTSFVYDQFNQLIAETDGVGNALASSNEPLYKALRDELGYEADKKDLSVDDKKALRNLYTERFAYDRVGNLLSIQDHLGRVTRYDYDNLNRMVLQTDAAGETQMYRYDGNGNRVSEVDELGRESLATFDKLDRLKLETDPLGSRTRYDYDTFNNITSRIDAQGESFNRVSGYSYDLNNRVIQETDPEGHRVNYEYDAVGNRLKVIDARGKATDYLYDAMNRNIKIIDPLSFETRFEYDGVGNQVKITDPRGGASSFTFDPGNRLIVSQDAEGRRTTFSYDELDNIITLTTGEGATGIGSAGAEVTRFEYDAENNLRAVQDAEGHRSESGFDRVYNQTVVTDENGYTTVSEFDALNRRVKITDADRGVTTFAYDAVGNTLSETDPLDRVTSYQYADDNQLLVVIDPAGTETHYVNNVFDVLSVTRAANVEGEERTRQFEYDRDGYLVKETDELGGTKLYTYNENHSVKTVTDENGNTTRYYYDDNNQVVRINDALDGNTRFTYDGNGNRTQVIDARGSKTTAYYNANNELALTVDALGYATSNTYDVNGNLAASTQYATRLVGALDLDVLPVPVSVPAEDRTSSYEYDALNQLVKQTDPEGGVVLFSYDAAGNQITQTDQNNRVTDYGYDVLDRLTDVTDALGGVRSYAYDAVGNQLSDTDENGHVTSYEYDVNDQIEKIIDPLLGERLYTYDAVGNTLSTTDENAFTTTFEYDKLDRQTRRVNAANDEALFVYDGVGNQLSLTDENGETASASYDALNRLQQSTDATGATVDYSYDSFGNEIERVDELGFATQFKYDRLNQLIQRTDAESGVRNLSYDSVGNNVAMVDESGVRTEYGFDLNDRLVSITDALGGVYRFGYDAAGNKTSETDERGFITDFGYDALNRLETQENALGGVKRFRYDAVGNPIQLTDENATSSAYLVYDANDRLVQMLSAEGYLSTYTYDARGSELERREYNERYPAGADGELLTPNTSDNTPRITTSTHDVLKRLVTSTDSTGLTTHYEYDAVGNPTSTYQSAATSAAITNAASATTTAAAVTIATAGSETVVYDKKGRVVSRTDAAGVTTEYKLDGKGNIKEEIEAVGVVGEERSTSYSYDKLNRLKSETNALGTTISYTYDGADRIKTRTTSGAGVGDRVERYNYDAKGRLASEENGVGNVTVYTYDASGNLTQTTFAANSPADRYTKTFEYDGESRLVAEVDGDGIRTEYVYDANGNKIETIQAKGIAGQQRSTTYVYDSENRLTSITNPEGGITRYDYDAEGNQFRITDANLGVTENTFDSEGRILTNTVGVGGVNGGIKTTNTYDQRGNVLSTTVAFANGDDPRTSTYEYDVLDRITKITDPEGLSSTFEYDSFGNQTRVTVGLNDANPTDPRTAPQVTRFEYDAADQLIRTIDGAGNAVASTYDLHGNRTSQTTGIATADSDDTAHVAVTNFSYDLDGKLLEKSTATGGVVKITRNSLGQQTLIETLQSGTTVWVTERLTYDSEGRVTAQYDFNSVGIFTAYDAVGNVSSVTRDGGRVTRYDYDLNSNLIAETDPIGAVTRFEYDAVGNRTGSIDAEGGSSRLYYNEFNQLVGATDALNNFTGFEVDLVGNVVRATRYATALTSVDDNLPTPVVNSAADRVSTQTFDKNGKRLSETAPNGTVKHYEFDSAGRLLKQTEDVSGAGELLAITYDETARVLTWGWDSAGRLTTFTNVDGVTEDYVYDAAGNKVSETVIDPNILVTTGAVDADRSTVYTYDLSNRLLTQTSGTNVQTLGYDKAGNVVTKTDALGHTTTTAYDRNNRVSSITDAKNQRIAYGYDAVGNVTTITDARGNVSSFTYDRADRVTIETTSSTTTYTLADGFETGVVTAGNTYDLLGNLVERTDESGNKITTWYDANSNVIAEVNVDLRLQKFTYNAFDEFASLRTYQTAVPESARNLSVIPTSNAAATLVTNAYDQMGNLVSTTYPAIDVTTVTGTGAAANATTTSQTPVESSDYDAWGNLVKSVDRRGIESYSYYDNRGRQIALVDGSRFIVTTAYDSQGNIIQQRKYETRLTAVDANTLPSPLGTASTVDRYYDAQGQLVREVSPPIDTLNGNERVTTVFGYDVAGNLKSKTLASGQAEQQTEYYYYDAINQRTAVVSNNRVLNTFSYDANGNLESLKRYFNTVASGVNLATASAPSVAVNTAQDQETRYVYNARNLLSTQTDEMSSGDIVSNFNYDASGNMTRKQGPEGNITEIAYDAGNRIVQTISPNGSHSFIDYDINGRKIRAWTGGDPASVIPRLDETTIAATFSGGPNGALDVNWSMPASADSATSWIAWDTSPHTTLGAGSLPSSGPGVAGAYAQATSSSGNGASRSVDIPVSGLTPGQEVHFRVMIKDLNNNLSWSEERSLVVPAALSELTVKQSGSDFIVAVNFSGAVANPQLGVTSAGTPTVTRANPSGDSYIFTVSGLTSAEAAAASLSFDWEFGGTPYTAPAGTILKAPEATENRTTGWIDWPLPTDGQAVSGSTQLLILNGQAQPESAMSRVLDTVQYEPVSNASQNYDIYYGDRSAEDHDVNISFTDTQNRVATFSSYVRNSDDEIIATNWNLTWKTNDNDLVRTTVEVDLEAGELPRVNADGVKVAYRTEGTDGIFTNVADTTADGNKRTATLDLAESASYDLKIYYVDTSGNEVIVDWRRIATPAEAADVAAGTTQTPGTDVQPAASSRVVAVGSVIAAADQQSLTVLASERSGVIGAGDTATRMVSEGLYSGPLDPAGPTITLGLIDEDSGSGGTKRADGLADGTYFTRIEYNELGMKVASNEGTGLWRTYGVDANGNQVHTRLFGSETLSNGSPDLSRWIDTYAAFDARNYETTRIGPVAANGMAAVTTQVFDYAGRVTSVTRPGNSAANANTYGYDGVGNLSYQTDAMGNRTDYAYDRLGNLVEIRDPEGHTQRMVYTFGNVTSTYFVGLSTANESYEYDAFGRRTSITNGAGQSTTMTYDQHDRVVTVTDALNAVTRYSYDKRDNQTWVQDANGNFFGSAYDAMGLLTNEYAFTSRPTSLSDAIAKVGSDDASLVNKETVYDAFNNKVAVIDAEEDSESLSYGKFGRLESAYGSNYEYDRFGRQIGESNAGGKNIDREYDAAGRLTRVIDVATSTDTRYTYDAAGNRATEVLTKSGTVWRSQTYSYNANRDLTRWSDSAYTNTVTTNYAYFGDGNIRQISGSDGTKDYLFDAADRVTKAGVETFEYDMAGNRSASTVGASTTNYTYDAAGRLDYSSVAGITVYNWTYDRVGNVTYTSGGGETTRNTYDSNNRVYISISTDSGEDPATNSTSTTYFDKTGRVTSTAVRDASDSDEVKTYTYAYEYNDDGLQTKVTGSGTDEVGGTSTSTYDVNGQLTSVNLGKGDDEDQERSEINSFAYDNDGKIVYATRDEGMEDESAVTTFYLYANGYAVGEFTSSSAPSVNENDYATVKTINPGYSDARGAFPGSSVSRHTVAAGNTFKSLAAQYYGSPDLWFVIAEANGLAGTETLKAGSSLLIPATAENAFHTADTHVLYNEGDIVGSKLPNLASPPPSDGDKCALVAAIILIVVVAIAAVVLTVVTVGAAAPAAVGALAAGSGVVAGLAATTAGAIVIGVTVGAVVGAAIAFAASALTQLILVGFGLQEEFDWKAVAADTVAGALGGAAAGLGAVVGAARVATTTLKVVNVVGQLALETAGEAASQAIQNDGEIANPWLIAVAGAGGAFGAVGDIGSRSTKTLKAVSKADDVADAGKAINRASGKGAGIADNLLSSTKGLDDLTSVAKTSNKTFDGDVFSKIFKAKWAEASDPLVSGIGSIKTGIKAASEAIADGAVRGGKAIQSAASAAFSGISQGSAAALTAVKQAGKSTLNAASRNLGKVSDALQSAGRSAKAAPGKAFQAVKEFKQAGTVLPRDGVNVNVVRFFETTKDGVRVAKYKQVVSTAKKTVRTGSDFKVIRSFDANGVAKFTQVPYTSKLTQLSRAPGAVASAVGSGASAVGSGFQAAGSAIGSGASAVGSGFQAAGSAIGSGARTAGSAVGSGFQAAGSAIVDGARTAGSAVGSGFQAAGSAIVSGARTAGSAVGSGFRTITGGLDSARTAGKNFATKGFEAIREFATKSSKPAVVNTLSKTERIKNALKSGIDTAGSALISAKEGAERLRKVAGDALHNAADTAFGVKYDNLADKTLALKFAGKQEKVGLAFGTIAPQVADYFIRKEENASRKAQGLDPLRKTSKRFATSSASLGGIGKLIALGPVGKAVGKEIVSSALSTDAYASVTGAIGFGGDFNVATPPIENSFITDKKSKTQPFDDRNARTTYADLHSRQHNWLALNWANVAANTTTQVFSPFEIDQSANAGVILSSHKMVAGQVNEFSNAAVVAFAERSVGGVGGEVSRQPAAVG